MSAFLVVHEASIRFAFFAGTLAVFATLESILPARRRVQPRRWRWPTNLLLMALGAILLRFAFPALAVGTAIWAQTAKTGLFHRLDTPFWLAFAASLIVLDLAVYGQHVAMHKLRLLWRLHRVHHADLDVDATTGVRFHPGEAAVSMAWKMALVVALGVAPAAVIAFEIILNATSVFNHSNLRLGPATERLLRLLLVTPDMHRIHHSQARDETDSNYGFNFALWDRLFGTYRKDARVPAFPLGLPGAEGVGSAIPWVALWLPFRRVISR